MNDYDYDPSKTTFRITCALIEEFKTGLIPAVARAAHLCHDIGHAAVVARPYGKGWKAVYGVAPRGWISTRDAFEYLEALEALHRGEVISRGAGDPRDQGGAR